MRYQTSPATKTARPPKRRVVILDDFGCHLMALYVSADTLDLENSNLEGMIAMFVTTLKGRNFSNSSLYSALLSGSDLSGCNFEGCGLQGANLSEALLNGASLRNADLGYDNLGGSANLCGADLSGANIDGCSFIGARFDSKTRFPKSFNPEAAGMKAVQESTAIAPKKSRKK